jgi:hypothetical protein
MQDAADLPDALVDAYARLRRSLSRAERAPGAQIRVDVTARTFGISPTPVREALARLAGERLVETRRREGFFVPRLSAGDLRELYELQEWHLLGAAARLRQSGKRPAQEIAASPGAGGLFAILEASGSRLLLDSGSLVIDRLALARREEAALVEGVAGEPGDLVQAIASGGQAGLAAWIRAYHRRRRAKSHAIAAALAALERRGADIYLK